MTSDLYDTIVLVAVVVVVLVLVMVDYSHNFDFAQSRARVHGLTAQPNTERMWRDDATGGTPSWLLAVTLSDYFTDASLLYSETKKNDTFIFRHRTNPLLSLET
jgi:hypothetical protein